MDNSTQNQPKYKVHTEHTPNDGKIYRCGKFTIHDRVALEYYYATDPVCREWESPQSRGLHPLRDQVY